MEKLILVLNIIFLILTLVLFVKKTRFGLHMLQQSSYLSMDYLSWCDENLMRNLSAVELLGLAVTIALYFVFFRFDLIFQFINSAAALFLVSLGLAGSKKYSGKNAKKPLVYTARVKRLICSCALVFLLVSGVTLYLSFKFATVYPFVYALILMTVFNFVLVAVANGLVRPVELAVGRHYYNDAVRILKDMPRLKIIGITGSYGKTSSKYILTRILSEKYNTLMTPESYNTPMGVIKTVRGSLKPTHEIFVCEMGAKYRKDIKELCDLVHPQYGLLTSIGPQHLETFKSIENIIATKFDLVGSLKNKANAVVNVENEYIAMNAPAEAVKYSVEPKNGANYWAENISYGPQGVKFTLCTDKGESVELESRLLGRHNILNIVGAAAAAVTMGMSLEDVVYPVRRLESVPHRLELKRRAGGVTVIDDAFNSNIEGAKSAVSVLGSFPEGGRILITPGIVEAGEKEAELNREFARSCEGNCDYIILVGKKQTSAIAEGLDDIGFDKDKLFVADSLKEALSLMNTLAKDGSTVLFENDLPDLYNEKII